MSNHLGLTFVVVALIREIQPYLKDRFCVVTLQIVMTKDQNINYHGDILC